MENILIIQFLKSFLFLFGAKIKSISHNNGKIVGTIRWEDDDENDEDQSFSWIPIGNESLITKTLSLCEFIKNRNLNRGDKMEVSENELLLMLIEVGWDKENAQKTLNFLCEIQIFMIDNGEETDSFFIHF